MINASDFYHYICLFLNVVLVLWFDGFFTVTSFCDLISLSLLALGFPLGLALHTQSIPHSPYVWSY